MVEAFCFNQLVGGVTFAGSWKRTKELPRLTENSEKTVKEVWATSEGWRTHARGSQKS
jgi:hypothetical protein